jgi:uncharacterized protein (DUF1697 family)
MAKYVALLRGVNVGGNMLRMERVREVFCGMGFGGVRTYIQSGNVVFEMGRLERGWCGRCEQELAGETRLAVGVIGRTVGEMRKIVEGNPFVGEKGVDEGKLHVTFLEARATSAGEAKLAGIKAGGDRYVVKGCEVYLYCPGGYGKSKLVNSAIERAMGMRATTRNWRTVKVLAEMAGGEQC